MDRPAVPFDWLQPYRRGRALPAYTGAGSNIEGLLMKKICTLLVLLGALAGCAVYTPDGAVIVDPHGSAGGGFCPPGQAKKGNC